MTLPIHAAMQRGLEFAGREGSRFKQIWPTGTLATPPRPSTSAELTAQLLGLSRTMIEPSADPEATGNRASACVPGSLGTPAGYTYFGQFVDHDLTFDPVSMLTREVADPTAVTDFRTPRFDLDSLYGSGPSDQPYLYNNGGDTFLLGAAPDGTVDLPRNSQGRALIGEKRNDENLLVSQLHLAFLKFHNAVFTAVQAAPGAYAALRAQALAQGAQDDFSVAHLIVRWHYQWIVLHDFLPRIVGQAMVDQVLATPPGGRLLDFAGGAFMPVEFAVAAYRFGHSMVRFDYDLNGNLGQGRQVFSNPASDLSGFRVRPAGLEIEWHRFFEIPGQPGGLVFSMPIDTGLSFGLANLPTLVTGDPAAAPVNILAYRNLQRGFDFNLPSGQAVAAVLGVPPAQILSQTTGFQVLRNDAALVPVLVDGAGLPVLDGNCNPVANQQPPANALKAKGPGTVDPALTALYCNSTPLWYYVLKEAEQLNRGAFLGPVGGRIVAETIIGLLDADDSSFRAAAPGWQPVPGEFGAGGDGTVVFGMPELLVFSGSPL